MPSISIGGRVLTIAPLNLKAMRILLPKLNALKDGVSGEKEIDALLDLATPALSRGNEGVTRDWLEEELSLPQIPELLAAIAEASGLKPVSPGEAPGP